MVVQAHTVVRSPKKDHIGRLFLTSENDMFKCSQIEILNPLRAAFIAKLKKNMYTTVCELFSWYLF